MAAPGRTARVEIERRGVTIAVEAVPLGRIAEVLDQVLTQLTLVERVHQLEAPPPAQSQVGYAEPVDVPD